MWFSSIAQAGSFMPPEASTFAAGFDRLYEFLALASLISTLLVIAGMVYFAIKYRRRSANDKSAYISHNATLEFLWSFIPFVIFMVAFAWGWIIYHDMRQMPTDALEVQVIGQKWNWTFVYKSGRKVGGELYVPVNQPVKLIMGSNDVIHSLFVPAFRVKQDVVPGRYTALWFEPTKIGDFQIFCTEYCGKGHSEMLAKIHVVSREQFDEWLMNDPYKGLAPAQMGQKIFQTRCTACHKETAEKLVGPGLRGLFGRTQEMDNGPKVTADENYIRESILNPSAKIVKGFPNAMTPFQGQLSEEEVSGVIEFIKSLK